MVNNEKYIKTLEKIVSCVSHGDYYSAKELSMIELEKIKRKEKIIKKNIKRTKYKTRLKNKRKSELNNLEKKELQKITKAYSKYMLNLIKQTTSIEKIQEEAISIYEFIEKQ